MDDKIESIYYDDKSYKEDNIESPETIIHKKEKSEPEVHIKFMGADKVWEMGFHGKGIVIALSDSGVNYKHPGIIDSYRGYNGTSFSHDYNWFDPQRVVKEPRDLRAHGTHCQGIANGGFKGRKVGVSPQSKWMHCLRQGGSTVIQCLQWFLAPTNLNNENPDINRRPHVTSHSYLCQNCRVQDAMQALMDAGVHVIVAAGNSGPGCGTVTEPARYPNVIAVAALSPNSHNAARFSSRGPIANYTKPNLSAPGESVISTSSRGETYTSKSGTSMASPGVAGAVALLWSAVPRLSRDIKRTNDIFFKSSYHQNTTDCSSNNRIPNNVYGYGTINVKRAVDLGRTLFKN